MGKNGTLDGVVIEELEYTGPKYSDDFLKIHQLFVKLIGEDVVDKPKFLWNRHRLKKKGPKTRDERVLFSPGYNNHLHVAKHLGDIIGGTYTTFLPLKTTMKGIESIDGAVAYFSFGAIKPEYEGKGVYKQLIETRTKAVEADAKRAGIPLLGYIVEVGYKPEDENEAAMLRKNGFQEIDIKHIQPAIDAEKEAFGALKGTQEFEPVPLRVFYKPCGDAVNHVLAKHILMNGKRASPEILQKIAREGITPEIAPYIQLSRNFVHSLIGISLLRKEYAEDPLKSQPSYKNLIQQLGNRETIGFRPPYV